EDRRHVRDALGRLDRRQRRFFFARHQTHQHQSGHHVSVVSLIDSLRREYIRFFSAQLDMIVAAMPDARRTRDGVTLFLAVLALYATVFGGRAWWLSRARGVRLYTAKPAYLHYEFVDIRLVSHDPALRERWRSEPPRVTVFRDGRAVTTIAGLTQLT